jgi:hypothetical protein
VSLGSPPARSNHATGAPLVGLCSPVAPVTVWRTYLVRGLSFAVVRVWGRQNGGAGKHLVCWCERDLGPHGGRAPSPLLSPDPKGSLWSERRLMYSKRVKKPPALGQPPLRTLPRGSLSQCSARARMPGRLGRFYDTSTLFMRAPSLHLHLFWVEQNFTFPSIKLVLGFYQKK